MEASKNALDRIITCVDQLKHLLETAPEGGKTAKELELGARNPGHAKKYEESMEDDFNTADAIAAIFELVKFANTQAEQVQRDLYRNFWILLYI